MHFLFFYFFFFVDFSTLICTLEHVIHLSNFGRTIIVPISKKNINKDSKQKRIHKVCKKKIATEAATRGVLKKRCS